MLRKKEWVLKIDMNTNNKKINNCSKQITMLTKTKSLITEQKTNSDNAQMNDFKEQMSMLWKSKWMTAKKEISMLRRNKNEWLLTTSINANNNQINHG